MEGNVLQVAISLLTLLLFIYITLKKNKKTPHETNKQKNLHTVCYTL